MDPRTGSLWQHIPLDHAARALEPGGPNFWHTAQVELIGWADTDKARAAGKPERAVVNWTDADYGRSARLARWIVRPLPTDRRGIAPTLQGLAGTWATDDEYATKIAQIANAIRAT